MSDQNEKVNWLRPTQFANGTTVSVSQKSGIVKVEIPGTGRRAPMLYRDEILTFLGIAIELQRFLDENQDICTSKEAAHESRKATQVKMRNEAKLAEALQSVDPETLAKLVQAVAQKKQA